MRRQLLTEFQSEFISLVPAPCLLSTQPPVSSVPQGRVEGRKGWFIHLLLPDRQLKIFGSLV